MPNMRNALRTLKGTPSRARAGTPAVAVLAVLALTSVGLVACGGSSGTTASQTAAAATSASSSATSAEKGTPSGVSTSKGGGPGGATGPNPLRKRFSAMRECLQKNGITLPAPSNGSGRQRGVLGALAGGQLPKGVTRAQLQAAFAKCGRGAFPGAAGGPGNFRRANSPAFRKALATYAGCLRQNGVNVPTPNTSGKGPVFSTKGLNTSSPQFKAATMKCRGVLLSGFRGANR